MNHLKIAHVKISNILGITELEFAPTGFTEIIGANGSGKTSTIEALRAALRGGHDATLLRKGADKGEIVLVLDDGTQIKKKVTPDSTDVKILRDERVLSRPAEVIRAIHDVLSVNPVEFLRAPEKERVNVLMQTMPIDVDMARLRAITKEEPTPGKQGLDLIEAEKKTLFDERTAVNRAARDKEGTINQLRSTLPDEIPDVPPTDAGLIEKLNAFDAERDRELQRIADNLAGIKAGVDDEIAALQAQIEAKKYEFAAVKDKAAAKESDARAKHAAARAEVDAIVRNIEEAQKQHARFEQTKDLIVKMVSEHEQLKADAQGLTESIEALEAYKSELLASLPIQGLEVREGKVYRHGIEFDRLNTAQQVEIAVEIAKLRAGELGLICVDGLELLDASAYEAFREQAKTSGLQMIVSRVGEGALVVAGGA